MRLCIQNIKKLIVLFVGLIYINVLTAQVLQYEKQEFYPGISTVYHFGNNHVWGSIERLDSLGRPIEKENYYKKELRSRENFVYNANNDVLYYISTFPNQIDTVFRYTYAYQQGRIVYQKMVSSKNDSTVTRLIENKADTLLIYNLKSYFLRIQTNTVVINEEIHTLKYQNGLLVYHEKLKVDENSKEKVSFEYYPNGRLKRRKLVRDPELEYEIVYGGLGSDDMYYKYKLDRFGRIKKLYYIIDGKRHRVSTYRYKK